MFKRVGIIGDIHAEDAHLRMALDYLHTCGVDVIVSTGDIADGGGCLETCVTLLDAHGVLAVQGNHDRWLLQDRVRTIPNAHQRDALSESALDYLQGLPTSRTLDTCVGPLLLCHGVADNDLRKVWPGTERMPPERSVELDAILDSGEVAVMINGHVHYRTLIHFEGLTLLNAGTLRGDHHPGFSLLDLAADTVESFEFGPDPQHVHTQPFSAGDAHRVFKNTQHFDGAWEPVTLYA